MGRAASTCPLSPPLGRMPAHPSGEHTLFKAQLWCWALSCSTCVLRLHQASPFCLLPPPPGEGETQVPFTLSKRHHAYHTSVFAPPSLCLSHPSLPLCSKLYFPDSLVASDSAPSPQPPLGQSMVWTEGHPGLLLELSPHHCLLHGQSPCPGFSSSHQQLCHWACVTGLILLLQPSHPLPGLFSFERPNFQHPYRRVIKHPALAYPFLLGALVDLWFLGSVPTSQEPPG